MEMPHQLVLGQSGLGGAGRAGLGLGSPRPGGRHAGTGGVGEGVGGAATLRIRDIGGCRIHRIGCEGWKSIAGVIEDQQISAKIYTINAS